MHLQSLAGRAFDGSRPPKLSTQSEAAVQLLIAPDPKTSLDARGGNFDSTTSFH